MQNIDIVLQTTWTASTSYIPLPSKEMDIAYVPTTLYIEGGGNVQEVLMRKYTTSGVQIDTQGVKHNLLKLRYRAVGELVRA